MPDAPKFYAAQLRWSDRHVGMEICPLSVDTGEDARRALRRHHTNRGETYGLMTVDELERDGFYEGSGVIVLALPRRMSDAEIHAAMQRIEAAVRADASMFG